GVLAWIDLRPSGGDPGRPVGVRRKRRLVPALVKVTAAVRGEPRLADAGAERIPAGAAAQVADDPLRVLEVTCGERLPGLLDAGHQSHPLQERSSRRPARAAAAVAREREIRERTVPTGMSRARAMSS